MLAVGKIVKAFGIRGDVIVQPMTDDPERFAALTRVYLGRSDSRAEAVETTVHDVRIDARGVRLRLGAIPDRTAAEQSVGLLLLVADADRIPLKDGQYFVHELIGVTVRSEEGEILGRLKDVIHMPAQDVYVVGTDGEDFMIPAVAEFVRGVDVTARTMTVRLIDGIRG